MRHQGVTLNFDKLAVHASNSAVRVTQHRLQTVYFYVFLTYILCTSFVWFDLVSCILSFLQGFT